jgi:hypothetical protein
MKVDLNVLSSRMCPLLRWSVPKKGRVGRPIRQRMGCFGRDQSGTERAMPTGKTTGRGSAP